MGTSDAFSSSSAMDVDAIPTDAISTIPSRLGGTERA